jgi:hypothetical protein
MPTAYYISDHVEVTFSAPSHRTDYGVAGSPVWDEIDPADIAVDGLKILGVYLSMKDLPAELCEAVRSLSSEVEF